VGKREAQAALATATPSPTTPISTRVTTKTMMMLWMMLWMVLWMFCRGLGLDARWCTAAAAAATTTGGDAISYVGHNIPSQVGNENGAADDGDACYDDGDDYSDVHAH
jgi:hypothetical protein